MLIVELAVVDETRELELEVIVFLERPSLTWLKTLGAAEEGDKTKSGVVFPFGLGPGKLRDLIHFSERELLECYESPEIFLNAEDRSSERFEMVLN